LRLPGGDKPSERIEDLAEKLGRRLYTYADPTVEQVWLHERAAALLERTKSARKDAYRFDRLARATDAVLEASEAILEARQAKNAADAKGDDYEDAARDLENDYFRVRQAEYFAGKSGEDNAAEYVKFARLLYQQARRAFDEKKYETAESLGDAASDVARALEYLAQASIRIPEPPRLEP
jgi:hypothetical protein